MTSNFNEARDIIAQDFYTISPSSTVSDWVDAFNNNAVSADYLVSFMGDTLNNGLLYDPSTPATIGGVSIHSLTNIDLTTTGASPDNLELDNFYIYFRSLNKIKLLDHTTFDITDYADGRLHLFFINSNLGFRIAESFTQGDDELCLFRFCVNPDLRFVQVYITAQRFGTSVYDCAGEYFTIQNCKPLAMQNGGLKMDAGVIKRSGIKFDYNLSPDLDVVDALDEAKPIRYITVDNIVDFNESPTYTVITDKILNYQTHTFTTINEGYTAQRVLYDVYSDCYVIQYGNEVFETLDEAVSSINSVNYDFPYDVNIMPMFLPIALMFIKCGYTDLTDSDQCLIIYQTNITTSPEQSLFFAEDAYARGKINIIDNQLDTLTTLVNSAVSNVNSHIANVSNPHRVTKAQVGLGNVDNLSYNEIKSGVQNDLSNNWIKKNANDSTSGKLTISGGVAIPSTAFLDNQADYLKIGGHKLYIGKNPSSISGASAGDYAIWPE